MIFLFTGVNGASKTLNAIKFINEDEQFKGRPVYYNHIRDVQPENEKGVKVLNSNWIELSDDDAKKWYEIEYGAVIFIDESHYLFPVITKRNGLPEHYINEITEHRRLGHDIVLVTQDPRNIDAFVRRLVGVHRHYERIMQGEKIKFFQWNKCVENVQEFHARKEGAAQIGSIDKKYFGTYKSAELHTHKARIKWSKIALIVIPILLLPFILYFGLSGLMSTGKEEVVSAADSVAPSGQQSSSQSSIFGGDKRPLTLHEYIDLNTPRISGLAFTAPIYDEVRKPVTYPKMNCVLWIDRDDCVCYSQQATRLQVDQDTCRQVVRNGLFDHAKPDPDPNEEPRRWTAKREDPVGHSRRQAFFLADTTPKPKPFEQHVKESSARHFDRERDSALRSPQAPRL